MLLALDDLNEWNMLGVQLGLRYPTLVKIRHDHHDKTDMCKMKMLAEWLQQNYNVTQNGAPSWSVLRDALRRMGEKTLASRIVVS